MAKWYVKRGEQESGPFDDSQVRQMASSGQIKSDDIIRREDKSMGRLASEIKGLWAIIPNKVSESKNESTQPIHAPSSETVATTQEPSTMQRVKDSAANVADFAKKQTKLKSMEFIKIPAQNFAVGKIALENRIGQNKFPGIYSQIEGLDEQVRNLRLPTLDGQNDTIKQRFPTSCRFLSLIG